MRMHVPPPEILLGGLTVAEFLRRHWQRKPLLVRGAWPGFADPISPEELAGLACEEGVESRLVLERDGTVPWELRHGPFPEQAFLELPPSHWTLLVQDTEKHLPRLAEMLQPFRFIPDWRVDDLQISYAPVGGSVGPHFDEYDVFLLQGRGRRHWAIDTRRPRPDNQMPDTELRILRDFQARQEWVLEPGDMLYLPPGVQHCGVALEPCLTYSIGMRAPSHGELVHGFLDFLAEGVPPELRYGDPDLVPESDPGRIDAEALNRVGAILERYVSRDPARVAEWFGCFCTEPKPGLGANPPDEPWELAELKAHLRAGGQLERNPGSRFAWMDHEPGQVLLFTDGQCLALSTALGDLAAALCRERRWDGRALASWLKRADATALLLDLLNEGHLVIYDDD